MPHKVCLQEANSSNKWEACVSSQWTLPIFAVLHLCHRTTQGEIASSNDQPLKFQLFDVYHTENLGPFPVIKVCHKSGRCSPWRLDFKSASSFHTVFFHGCSLKLTKCPVASWRTALSTLARSEYGTKWCSKHVQMQVFESVLALCSCMYAYIKLYI